MRFGWQESCPALSGKCTCWVAGRRPRCVERLNREETLRTKGQAVSDRPAHPEVDYELVSPARNEYGILGREPARCRALPRKEPLMSRLALLISFVALFGLVVVVPVVRTSAQDGLQQRETPDADERRSDASGDRCLLGGARGARGHRPSSVTMSCDLVDVGQVDPGPGCRGRSHHRPARADLRCPPEVVNLIVGEGKAAGSSSSWARIPASSSGSGNRSARGGGALSVFYDLDDGQITALRIHGFASGFVAALRPPKPRPHRERLRHSQTPRLRCAMRDAPSGTIAFLFTDTKGVPGCGSVIPRDAGRDAP